MKPDYKITRKKFFDEDERRQIMKYSENMALADKAKGRRTWQVRWMLVHLAMYSGLRLAEITNLEIKNIHLKGSQKSYIQVINGKGGRDRDVYINDNLAGHLREFIQGKKDWDESTKPEAPLFAGRNGKYTKTALTLSFKEAVKQSGLRTDLSIHSARHTYATFLYKDSGSLKHVQNQLGHSSIAMTSLYADILPEENGRLANMITYPEPENNEAPSTDRVLKRGIPLANLKQSAKELNEKLGLQDDAGNPGINIDADRLELESKLREASTLITPDDELTPETLKILDKLSK